MAIITLTTDFGMKDHYVGAIKGGIYSELDSVNIVDISHLISPFNITEASYIIKNAYKSFPAGTIHIIGIDGELTPENRHIAVYLDGHYFVCSDNGIMCLLTQEIIPQKIVEINIHDHIESSFPVMDVFVKTATHLARGGTLEVIGKPIDKIKQIIDLKPVINTNGTQILGSVLYIDNYGNVVTNITRKLFIEIGKGRSFEILARTYKFRNIYNRYSDAINFSIEKAMRDEDGKKLAIFNSADYLELAIYKSNPVTVGGANTLFGLHFRDPVTINFEKQ
ncbi:S-adenosyl-l-methionine hydroxide adenosyltransferase family protein [Ascidiimonas sp. W6]|uniref:SAM hydrolase/SAM-dependent halogenase family protein n=1 Tax=Ascidiimonas meishanensis TaxID=3128903 RepID=UPI0030EB9972